MAMSFELPRQWTLGVHGWRLSRTTELAAYLVVLPVVVAVLPLALPLLAAAWLGWRGAWQPGVLLLLPFWLLTLVWALQVWQAADDDIVGRLDDGSLPEELAVPWRRWLAGGTLALMLLTPLLLPRVHAKAESLRFRATSSAALEGARAAMGEHRGAWLAAYAPTKAFAPDDDRLDPDRFRGPFAADESQTKNKLVFREDGVAYYILDRPRAIGPTLYSVTSKVREDDPAHPDEGLWRFERGLVHVPRGADLPAATCWDMPFLRTCALGGGWHWYVAGEGR